jgi:Domain of unknown function (DUF4268)
MYTKEFLSKQRTKFWTSFGQYMKPIRGSGDGPVNWLNYKTGKKHLYFKMEVTLDIASISIELRQIDEGERLRYYNQFVLLQQFMERETGYQWDWKEDEIDAANRHYSSISISMHHVSIARESDWPAIISFLKPGMVALDSFWEMVKDGFE